jgi:hypothetical protein
MRQFLIVALAISIIGTFSISAHDHKGKGGQMGKEHFKKMDTDGNGKISKEEFQKFHDAKFTEMDKDADGALSEEEIQSYHKEKGKEMSKGKEKGKNKGKGKEKSKEEDKDEASETK